MGPWILVLHTWWCLIHRELHGLIMCHGHMASNVAHVATWSDVSPTGPT
ncbi:hypothetical protein BIFBRE_05070 [Bifidobacterium breve DSM 20213 = JCM 1192]|uniref:Uncharacterized protein n=1 Tax=Bifidobacterium breve DSM 20213 = JCM 1192 TaxID=518634 RepID=D4BSH8_BIFBR|nr:hypothetical protein BIFBRE_05070 [Bifidobacterium breve DSM 20213 = JCM 1192]